MGRGSSFQYGAPARSCCTSRHRRARQSASPGPRICEERNSGNSRKVVYPATWLSDRVGCRGGGTPRSASAAIHLLDRIITREAERDSDFLIYTSKRAHDGRESARLRQQRVSERLVQLSKMGLAERLAPD